MPLKMSPNERMRKIAAEISGDVFVRVDTTLGGDWLHVTLYYGDARSRISTINNIDQAIDLCLDDAEIQLGMCVPETLEGAEVS